MDKGSSMNRKIKELTEVINAEAGKRGLIFVNGPDTGAVALQIPSPRQTNGHERFVYLFGVGEPQKATA
jgi:hypothetical protein